MDLSSWGIPGLTVSGWGITPVSLVAPLALLILIMMGHRLREPAGPKMATRDVAGAAVITGIVGAGFLWIHVALGLMSHIGR
jgi:hypothetical protein